MPQSLLNLRTSLLLVENRVQGTFSFSLCELTDQSRNVLEIQSIPTEQRDRTALVRVQKPNDLLHVNNPLIMSLSNECAVCTKSTRVDSSDPLDCKILTQSNDSSAKEKEW